MQSILGNTRKADIIFYASGRIDITANVSRHLRLNRGDVIDILVDQGEFYLFVKHRAPINGRHDGTVYPTNSRGNHFRCSSRALCSAILNECKMSQQVKLCVGEVIKNEPSALIPIITKHIL